MENRAKPQIFYEPDGRELYGYPNPIVHNEMKEGMKIDANSDLPPKQSLHSQKALEAAARTLDDE